MDQTTPARPDDPPTERGLEGAVDRLATRAHRLPVGVADALLAALLTAVTVAAYLFADHDPPRWLGLLLVVLTTGPLTWRRTAPETVITVSGLATVAYFALGYDPAFAPLGILFAVYAVAAYGTRTASTGALIATLGFMGLSLLFISLRGIDIGIVEVTSNVIVFVTAWALGDSTRARRALVEETQARLVLTEEQHQAQAQRAVAEERARIARELHDVVAHTVSVLVVQAGAARHAARREPEQAVETLGEIEDTGRAALADLRRMLGVLRSPDTSQGADLAPQPSIASLTTLVERMRDTGLPVTLRVEPGLDDLPAGMDVSVYRMVQEALTNVLKHAGPVRSVEVSVTRREGAVQVEVLDDGRGAAAPSGDGPGHGLVGMQERAGLYGGTVDAGPRRGGGWRVQAALPLPGRAGVGSAP